MSFVPVVPTAVFGAELLPVSLRLKLFAAVRAVDAGTLRLVLSDGAYQWLLWLSEPDDFQ